MVSTKIWKEKRVVVKENEAEDDPANDSADGTAKDPADDTIGEESSQNSEDIPTYVNMVFVLPAEFRAPEA